MRTLTRTTSRRRARETGTHGRASAFAGAGGAVPMYAGLPSAGAGTEQSGFDAENYGINSADPRGLTGPVQPGNPTSDLVCQ